MATQITTELIKQLRDSTGISVMQCKKALEESMGDMEKAILILKKTSSDIALKKGGRELKDGSVMIKSTDEKVVLVSLLCETDFVSRNEDFMKVLGELSDKALLVGIDKMKEEAKDLIDPLVQKTGENIQLGEMYEVSGDTVGAYLHNNKSGVIVSLTAGSNDLAKDIAMHITAMKPEFMDASEISDEVRNSMNELFEKEVASIDKPEDIKKKMLEGKINTYFKERTLTEQPFIKNGEETVGQLLEKSGAKIKEVKRYSI